MADSTNTTLQFPSPGCLVLINTKYNNRKSWELLLREGFSIGLALKQYRWYHLFYKYIKTNLYYDTVKFIHNYITQTTVTPEYRIFHAINFMSCVLKDFPTATFHPQMDALKYPKDFLSMETPYFLHS